jgi:1-phosphofructokinase
LEKFNYQFPNNSVSTDKVWIVVIYTVTLNTAIDRVIYIDGILSRKKNNKVKRTFYDIGGKATHVSVVLSRLRIPNIATGFVGEKNKEKLMQLLEEKGVACDFIAQAGCPTRETLVILDDAGEGSFMITEKGFSVHGDTLEKLKRKLSEKVTEGDFAVFAGSLPPGLDGDQYRELLQAAAEKGGKLILDTTGAQLRSAIRLKPYAIKPNEDEFQELVGKRLNTPDEYASEIKKLLQAGIEYVIVTLGKKGSLVGHGDEVYRVLPPKVKEVNDTGCGDVFVGGFVAGLHQRFPLEKMIRFATALSASKAEQPESSAFSPERAEQLEGEVVIRRLPA